MKKLFTELRTWTSIRDSILTSKGALQVDAYAGFHHFCGDDVYEAECWVHSRRKFHEIHVIHASPTTTKALTKIGTLYAIEEEIRGIAGSWA